MRDAVETVSRSRSLAWRCYLVLIGVVAAIPCDLSAQAVSPGVALGVAVPTGDYGETRSPGPLANLSLTFREPESRIRFRVEGEAVWLSGRGDSSPFPSSSSGDLRILSVLASMLLAPNTGGVRPYFVIGGGPQWLSVPNGVNPYGTLYGVRAAIGLEGKWRGRSLRSELGAHAVLSDYATGRDFGLGTFVPFTVGVQF
jgi:hypothetical protein